MNLHLKPVAIVTMLGILLVTGFRNEIHGTLVVIGWSQTKIVIAADSRGSDLGANPHDDVCKIIPLDDHSVFTAAGFIKHSGTGINFWDGFAEATSSFTLAKNEKPPTKYLRASAVEWGKHVTEGINEGLIKDRTGTMAGVEDDRFVSGMFIGFENGHAAMYQEEISFNQDSRIAVNRLDKPKAPPDLHWGAMGRNETAGEILMGRSDFARGEQGKWAVLGAAFDPKDRDVYWAIQLIKISMIYNPQKQEIGGPVDALEITSKGIRWINRKPACQ